MNNHGFDELIKDFGKQSRSRRAALKLLAGGALAALVGWAGPGARLVAGAAGCRKVGAGCRRAAQCCSGICRGPKGKKTCRAHGVGTCKRGQDICRQGDAAAACSNPDVAECVCGVTTSDAGFCFDLNSARCAACERDPDCVEKHGFPRGSACIRAVEGGCEECARLGTACAAPCGADAGAEPR